MKFGGDFNYLPLKATFTVNYGGVYDFGSIAANNVLGDDTYNFLLTSIKGIDENFKYVKS